MPGNPALAFTAVILDLIGFVGLLLTKSGIVPGFNAFSPIFFAASAVFYIVFLFGLASAPIAIIAMTILAVFFEGIFRFGWWGLWGGG